MANPDLYILGNADIISNSSAAITVAAGSVTNFPATNIQHPHLGKTWRHTTVSSIGLRIQVSGITDHTFNAAYVLGHNLSSSGEIYIYAHSSDLGALKGSWNSTANYNGGSMTKVPSSASTVYKNHAYEYPGSTINQNWIAIFFEDSSLSYIECGRIVIGLKSSFDSTTGQFQRDPSDISEAINDRFKTYGGQVVGNKRYTRRRLALDFDLIDTTGADFTTWRSLWESHQNIDPFVVHAQSGGAIVNDLMYATFDMNDFAVQYHSEAINHASMHVEFLEHK